jgi:KDO2-lipid IV(A) lauroyltransferase
MGRPVAVAHYAEYAALRSAVGVFGAIGLRSAGRVAARIGRAGYSPLGIRRRVVEEQLRASFPDWSEAEVARIARASYGSLARTTIEAALISDRGPQGALDLVERVDGWEIVEERLARGKGMILVAGHLGNWELAAAYFGARAVRIEVIARHMANPLVDGFLSRARVRSGMGVVYDEDAVRRGPRLLREGGVLGCMVDQATLGLASTWVPFLGRPAKTPRGPAVFALRLGAPMVFVAPIRTASGRYHLTFEPVDFTLTGDREADTDHIVRAYTGVLERWVRRVPEQYFWQHRRWKYQPPADLEVAG